MTVAKERVAGVSDAEGEIPDVYYLENVEQLRALSEPLRYQMCLLLEEPRTGAALARALGTSRAKAHYHLKQLEAVGLVRPHSEGLANGIVEKFYVVVGRMLDFSRLLPPEDALIPDNVSPETVGAVSDFLAAMLDVSRRETRRFASTAQIGKGHYFDFESKLTPEQFDEVRARLAELRRDILDMTREAGTAGKGEQVTFHITNYLSRLGDPA